MLDPWAIKLVQIPLKACARILKKKDIKPDQVTIAGFGIGLLAFFALWMNWYIIGLFFIILNRFMDGLDGALARLTNKTDAGGFLDICLDFIFYSGMVAGFALADPQNNAIPAVFLLLSFVGTGTSFLAFAVMAQKYDLNSLAYPHKAMYYIGGLTEGTETIIFFTIICIFPDHFSFFAFFFAFLCLITTITRVWSGYARLKEVAKNKEKMVFKQSMEIGNNP
ncbi:MAG: CDP-alcohol phosphatidyltransferase family protein [Desulfobacula sp.]|uniref:CDP-alcohol phosphatidyltransferase family protein n=1 Tax=Desulfobacula sp. TaxID=2593537 RepID=UPI0025C23D63|nr:CDP-alcohol phosphatidyltransferase family protein [Desulfobacula sp.]MCD4721202.1 CDP-alcohol phosphatidyltransferase family protein [Desulfobacula sp.]